LPASSGVYTIPSGGVGGVFTGTATGDQYLFQPYTTNNVTLLNNSFKTATMNVTGTANASYTLSFLSSTGGGGSTVTVTVTFADSAPTASGLTFSAPDWFNGNNAAYAADGRITPGSQIYDAVSAGNHLSGDSGNPRLYAELVTLPLADVGHPISSISLSWSGSGNTAVFGVSTGVPEPASVALCAVGVLGLLARRRTR
jgi:hypothetical protein